jgi:hypothetical protein
MAVQIQSARPMVSVVGLIFHARTSYLNCISVLGYFVNCLVFGMLEVT